MEGRVDGDVGTGRVRMMMFCHDERDWMKRDRWLGRSWMHGWMDEEKQVGSYS